ncbi:MAG: 1-deoxy-D-xylulose-5-phosphate synthase [Kiritimatiellae bacterium]|nr:1-deoxy-D-xylulose-5-phosphate synthase [Kiritimatiellia bacterium]
MISAADIRKRIVDVTFANGGHLASSLGAVEISMALAEVFEPERDRIVWDVGHQAYAWKLLTGRWDSFSTLRKAGGVAPFPNPSESRADAAVAGHAGSAFSVALGMAAARDRRGSGENVVAVIGDGSIVNGHSFEALNNCAAATKKLIVVLNDNGMSISKPAGSFARFLGRLITGVRYNRIKAAAEAAGHRLRLTFLRGPYHRLESRIKGLFLGSRFFEGFGVRYIGPVDGHDLSALKAAFTVAKEDKRSVLVHVVTKKGMGYPPAERNPTAYHGVQPAARSGASGPHGVSWSDAFGRALCEAARKDDRIVALTAGMTDGTGLAAFAKEFPERFFDVGITEGHMVGFAAGLAAGGMKPVVAVYSSFLQRAVDQVVHDVAISSLPVVFCVDRAGVVGADGVTHQGIYDIALLRCVPNLSICQPKDAADLSALLDEALGRKGPTAIRYPRGAAPSEAAEPPARQSGSSRAAIWTTGDWYGKAAEVARRVGGCEVVHARYLKPFDSARLAAQRAAGMKVVSLENGCVSGGFGESIGADLRLGWPDTFVPHGAPAELERKFELDTDSVVRRVSAFLDGRGATGGTAIGG